jgi:hypothetical protein
LLPDFCSDSKVPDIMRVSLIVSFFALVFQFNAFSQARVFEPGVISNDQVFGGSFTPDGKEVYFTAAFGGRDSLQIFYSKKIKGIWEKPQIAPFAEQRFKQIDPFISPDGTTALVMKLIPLPVNFMLPCVTTAISISPEEIRTTTFMSAGSWAESISRQSYWIL